MRNVVLLCAAGMSTGVLVKRIIAEAQKAGYEMTISAHPMSEAAKWTEGADLVLLGPQVRYNLDVVRKQVKCPVEVVDMQAYGMVDGKKVLGQIKKLLGDQ